MSIDIATKLSPDQSELLAVAPLPPGTGKVKVAYMQNVSGSGVHYDLISPERAEAGYAPPAGYPVVSMQAATNEGKPIFVNGVESKWSPRWPTVPGGVKPPSEEPAPKEPPTPPAGMVVGLDIGGWEWSQEVVNNEAGCVRHFRSSFRHFNTDAKMDLLTHAGIKLWPLCGEGGTLASYNSSTFFAEIVAWFRRYGKGGTYWQGKPVDLGADTCELINEPGNPYFYPDYANHGLYATITKAAKAALTAAFGAHAPKLLVSYDGGYNGSEYGRAVFAAGAVADGVTVHPYGGHGSNSALGGRQRVIDAGTETKLPVYVTEVGWPTAIGQPPTGDSLQWTEQQQVDNATGFIKWARGLGYVALVIYFNYADYGTNNWYGVVDKAGVRRKPLYGALGKA